MSSVSYPVNVLAGAPTRAPVLAPVPMITPADLVAAPRRPSAQRPRRPPLSKGVLNFTAALPARRLEGAWYCIEDNLVPEDQLLLQWCGRYGEARCSSATSRLLNGSDKARKAMVGSYGAAALAAPGSVMVDLSQWAPAEHRAHRVAMDPVVALREGVEDLLVQMMKIKDPTPAQQAAVVAAYVRLRDRVAYMRDTFTLVEGAFELMQNTLVGLLGDGGSGDAQD